MMQIEQPSASETPTTILVVDDAESIRDVIKKVLRNCGYTVLEAKVGEACMRFFQEHSGPIHLLITDMFMTGMNGREVADRPCFTPGYQSPLYVRSFNRDNSKSRWIGASIRVHQKALYP